MKKIYKFDPLYAIVKPYVNYCFRYFYSSVTVDGIKNIKDNKPVILAANHQNALMDALAILLTNPGRTIFLARSDIFRNKAIAAVLTFLRIMPIYRIRDGRDELSKNEDVFDDSAEVLHKGHSLCLMPEGQQSFKRTLLPLVKGTFRIAFRTQESMPDKAVSIIPIGIDYGDYVSEGRHLIIRYGVPINVMSHMPEFNDQPGRALRTLQSELGEGLDGLIQNIRSEEHYEEIYRLSKMFCREMCGKNQAAQSKIFCCETGGKNQVSQLDARRHITKTLDSAEQQDDERFASLIHASKNYFELIDRHSIPDSTIATSKNYFELIDRHSIPDSTIATSKNYFELIDQHSIPDSTTATSKNYFELIDQHSIPDSAITRKRTLLSTIACVAGLFVTAPIALFAWLINVIPTYVPRIFTRKFKHKDFVSSVNFVGYIVLNLLVAIILLVVSIFTPIPWWSVIVLFFLTPISRRIVYAYVCAMKSTFGHIRYMSVSSETKQKLTDLRKNIKNMIDTLLIPQF